MARWCAWQSGLLLAALSWWVASPTAVMAASPVPQFPLDALAVEGVPDQFSATRAGLATFSSAVGAEVAIAVVAFTDPQDRPGPGYGDDNYINGLVNAWLPHMDAARAIIILLSIENRDIVVHPGSDWVMLGFEQQAVISLIDSSRFGSYARAGNMNQALLALVEDIDQELDRRLQRVRTQHRRSLEQLEEYPGRVESLQSTIDDSQLDDQHISDRLQALRESLNRSIQEADRAAEATIPGMTIAIERSRAFEESLRSTESEVRQRLMTRRQQAEQAALVNQQLAEMRELSQTIQLRAREAGLTPDEIEAIDRSHQEQLDQIEGYLVEGQMERAQSEISSTRQNMISIQTELSQRLSSQSAKRVLLLAILFVLLVVLPLVITVVSRILHMSKKQLAKLEIEWWEERLKKAGENLLSLENEYPLILGRPDLATAFQGKSAELAEKLVLNLDNLFLSYEAATRQLHEAKQLVEKAGPLSFRPMEQARVMLSTAIVTAHTKDVTERQLFLSDQRDVQMAADHLLQYMQKTFEQTIEEVESLDNALSRVLELMSRANAAFSRLEGLFGELVEAGLDPLILRETVEQQASRYSDLRHHLERDPLQVEEELLNLLDQVDLEAEQTEAILERVRLSSNTVQPGLETIATEIVKLREQEGLLLEEPGFEPDFMLDHIRRLDSQVWLLAARADIEEALSNSDESVQKLDELAELLERTRNTKENGSNSIRELQQRLSAARSRLPERKQKLDKLRAAHHDDALRPALDNIEEAEEAMAFADRCLNQAKLDIKDEVQRYLAADELIRRATAVLEQVDQLFAEIDDKERELARLRTDAEASLNSTMAILEEFENKLADETKVASSPTIDAISQCRQSSRDLQSQSEDERPHWPLLAEQSSELSRQLEQLAGRLANERRAFEEAKSLLLLLKSQRDSLQTLLDSSEDDRPAANEAFQTGVERHRRAKKLAKQEGIDWHEVLSLLKEAEQYFEQSSTLAQKDFAQATEARLCIGKASQAIQNTDRTYLHGVRADLTESRRDFDAAREALKQSEYEEAIKLANAATNSTIAARRQAEQRVMQLGFCSSPRSRYGQSFGHSHGSGFGGSFGAHSSRSNSNFGTSSSSSSSSFGASSSSSSFGSSFGSKRSSSGFGASSSFGSKSSASSFGRSSGGSSFGRSSGGMKFGSSSGGKKW